MLLRLDEHQKRAFDAVVVWYQARKTLTFSIGGFAGTGKTTLIKHLLKSFRNVSVCAYTGKAVHVLQQKGVPACTLHRLLYDYDSKDEHGQPIFEPKPVGALAHLKLVIVDEASMVSRDLSEDLLKHNIPVLWVGDHGQLEPVGAGSVSLVKEPQVRLEHIHRQALDSGIIDFSHHLRQEKNPYEWNFDYPAGTKPDVVVYEPNEVSTKMLFKQGFDVILVGTNEKRICLNQELRSLHGFKKDQEPQPGEPLLILRNSYRYGVFNGQVVIVKQVIDRSLDILWIHFATDDGREGTAPFIKTQFNHPGLLQKAGSQFVLADFGYALTGHKGQGSEWDRVVVLEEKIFSDPRWRYTAATRAAEHLVYVPHDRNWIKARQSNTLVGTMLRRPKKKLPKREPKKADPKRAAAVRERMRKRAAKQ